MARGTTRSIGARASTTKCGTGQGGKYDLSAHSHNGFVREFTGLFDAPSAPDRSDVGRAARPAGIRGVITNHGTTSCSFEIADNAYGDTRLLTVDIGACKIGQTPGGAGSLKWNYVSGSAGTQQFGGLPEGQFFLGLFLDDGYAEAAPRLAVRVVTRGDVHADGASALKLSSFVPEAGWDDDSMLLNAGQFGALVMLAGLLGLAIVRRRAG